MPCFQIPRLDALDSAIELIGTMMVGRGPDNTIVLNDETVSQCHAVLLIEPEGVLLLDLDSTNGTFVNGLPAQPDTAVRLADGDVVIVARTAMYYRAGGSVRRISEGCTGGGIPADQSIS